MVHLQGLRPLDPTMSLLKAYTVKSNSLNKAIVKSLSFLSKCNFNTIFNTAFLNKFKFTVSVWPKRL